MRRVEKVTKVLYIWNSNSGIKIGLKVYIRKMKDLSSKVVVERVVLFLSSKAVLYATFTYLVVEFE